MNGLEDAAGFGHLEERHTALMQVVWGAASQLAPERRLAAAEGAVEAQAGSDAWRICAWGISERAVADV